MKRPVLLRPFFLRTDHASTGLGYLLLSSIALIIGTVLSLLMRLHLANPNRVWPGWGVIQPEDYLALVTIHGTLMLFFVMSVAPQLGFASLILPGQIGANRMAFPRLNWCGMALLWIALAVLLSAAFVHGGSPISGWTAYPPLSAVASAGPGQGLGMDLWLIAMLLFSVASILGSVNLLVTVALRRCTGMTWSRLPLTVWAWITATMLSVLAFSVLLAALLLLAADRHAGTSFFLPADDLVNGTLHTGMGGSPLLWLHLFWFFGHPEVYIAILPGMGLTSMVLANFSFRRVFGYPLMIATTLLIGGLGILVWGHHMFVSGMSPFAGAAFSISTMAIALPSAAKVFSWLATLWRARPRYTTAMLFAIGFVSLFVTGGLSGPILAQPILDQYVHNTYFVVAHFHLIMAMAGAFGLFIAVYYWFPQLSAAATGTPRLMSERLGHWHFWLTLIGAYLTFLPMHVAGLMGMPRHYAQITGLPNPAAQDLLSHAASVQKGITHSALFLATAQLLFLWNVLWSLRRGQPAEPNPWAATTLEWRPPASPAIAFCAPCQYVERSQPLSGKPQWSDSAIDLGKRE